MMANTRLFSALWACGALIGGVAAPAVAQGTSRHPEVSREKLFFHCRLEQDDRTKEIEVALNLATPELPAKPEQVIELPAPFPPVRVLSYLPWARLKQTLVPDPGAGANPAMMIAIEGPKLAYRRGLMANDPARNQMVSLIASWRYMTAADTAARDELFKRYENERTRDPRIIIRRTDLDKVEAVPVEPGKVHVLEKLGCTVRVKGFFPNFTAGREPSPPSPRPERRLNPAVRLEIEWAGKKEEWLVFTRFPDFNKRRSKKGPFIIRLDCPVDVPERVPDFVLVTVSRFENEVWMRYRGKTTARPFPPGERVEIPGSKYTFRLAKFSPAGRIVDDYELTRARTASPVLRIATVGEKGEDRAVWLRFGQPRTLRTRGGLIHVRFGRRGSNGGAGR